MALTTFDRLIRQLYHVATAYDAPFPVYRRPSELTGSHPTGLGYWMVHRVRRQEQTPWFTEIHESLVERQAALARGSDVPTYDYEQPLLFVFWPKLLRYAFKAVTGDPLRSVAWDLMQNLYPFISKYDKVLEYALPQLAPTDVFSPLIRPLVGLAEMHLHKLTADRRFRRDLGEVMNASLRIVEASAERKRIHRCPSGRHTSTATKRCDQCAHMNWMLYSVNLLWPERVYSKNRGTLMLEYPANIDYPFEISGAGDWDKEFQWMLSCREPKEGAVTLSNGLLLVNFAQLRKQAIAIKRPSILARFNDDEWSSGTKARIACEAHAKGCVTRDPETPLHEYVAAHGWEVRDALDTPYALFQVNQLYKRFSSNYRLSVSRPRRKSFPSKRRPRVWLEYPNDDGMLQVIWLMRRKRFDRIINYFTTPWGKELGEPKGLVNGYRWEGEYYWTVHGFTNYPKPDKLKASLENFERWMAHQDSLFTTAHFKKVLFDQRLSERIADVQSGSRDRLSIFSLSEDAALTQHMRNRAPGRITDVEWIVLAGILPGRTRIGIQRRIEKLAKDYALENGWDAYMSSGWKTNNFKKREYYWRKDGVR